MKHEDDVSKAYTYDIPEIEREDRFFIAIQMVCDWRPIGYIGSSFNSYINSLRSIDNDVGNIIIIQ